MDSNSGKEIDTECVPVKKVNLAWKKLHRIPDSVLQIAESVKWLTLDRNWGIAAEDLKKFVHLRKLSLQACGLLELPEDIACLKKLEHLDISENHRLNRVPALICQITALKVLTVRSCGLTQLPEGLERLTSLEQLDVTSNEQLTSLPLFICQLGALKVLRAGRCGLTKLPVGLERLTSLEQLDVASNEHLTSLPLAISQLAALKVLRAERCGLTKLPDGLDRLTSLKELDVSFNNLSSLPSALGSLQTLEVLKAGNNNMRDFPVAVLGLRRLESLDLSNFVDGCSNSITELPVNLLGLTRLAELKLRGNKMVQPPEAICDQGLKAVLAYLRDVSAGRATLCMAAFSLLGETGAGKTSLVRSLKLGAPCTTASEDRTRVLEQHHLPLLSAAYDGAGDGSGRSSHMVFNDFGGHSIYQTVLPVLLPPRGIALLVYDVTEPDPERTVNKWLTTVLAASPDTRLLVVGTHCDLLPAAATDGAAAHRERMASFYGQRMAALQAELKNRVRELRLDVESCSTADYPATARSLRQKLEQLRLRLDTLQRSAAASPPPLVVSCVPRDPIESALLDEMSRAMTSFVVAPPVVPVSWCRLIKELLEPPDHAVRQSSYLTYEAVEKMFFRHFPSVADPETLTFILVYLTETSQVIWLKDHDSLSKFVFHRVDHVIEMFKAVLCHDDLSCLDLGHYAADVAKYKEGILSERLLHKLLEQFVSEDCEASALVELLVKFHLISLVNSSVRSRVYVIPSRLPEQPQAFVGSESSSSKDQMRVHAQLSFFGSVIPLGFFETSLTVVLQHADQQNVESLTTCWRDGASFSRNGVTVTCQRMHDPAIKHGFIFDITASSADIRRLWIVAQPLLDALAVYWTTSWPGAWYRVLFLCPACEQSGRRGADVGSRHFELDYGSVNDLLSNRSGGRPEASPCCLRNRDEYSRCPKCGLDVPLCLQSICAPDSLTVEDENRVKTFLARCDSGSTQPESLAGSREQSDLRKRFKKARSSLINELDQSAVLQVVDILYSEEHITEAQMQEIQAEAKRNMHINTARCLVDVIESRGDGAIRAFMTALESKYVQRSDLAQVLRDMQLS